MAETNYYGSCYEETLMIFLDLLIYSPFFLVMSCLYYSSFGPYLWTIVSVLMENIKKIEMLFSCLSWAYLSKNADRTPKFLLFLTTSPLAGLQKSYYCFLTASRLRNSSVSDNILVLLFSFSLNSKKLRSSNEWSKEKLGALNPRYSTLTMSHF